MSLYSSFVIVTWRSYACPGSKYVAFSSAVADEYEESAMLISSAQGPPRTEYEKTGSPSDGLTEPEQSTLSNVPEQLFTTAGEMTFSSSGGGSSDGETTTVPEAPSDSKSAAEIAPFYSVTTDNVALLRLSVGWCPSRTRSVSAFCHTHSGVWPKRSLVAASNKSSQGSPALSVALPNITATVLPSAVILADTSEGAGALFHCLPG